MYAEPSPLIKSTIYVQAHENNLPFPPFTVKHMGFTIRHMAFEPSLIAYILFN